MMTPASHPRHWIVTADTRRAVLYACQRLPEGGVRLEQHRVLENPHEDEHERHRPVLAGGGERRGSAARSAARAAPQSIAPKRTAEEEQMRFAREVGEWLDAARQQLGAGKVTVFAPPRFLGLLRVRCPGAESVELREADLSRLREGELALHPAVVGAVTGP